MTKQARRKRIVLICLFLFALSFGIRLIVWQNNRIAFEEPQPGIMARYQREARWIADGDWRHFLEGEGPPSDTTIIMHPPGYPLFIAPSLFVFGRGESARIVQIALNSLAPAIVFLFALGLVGYRTALISGVLTAFSPQAAYYAGVLLPDGLSVLPILIAAYLILKRGKAPRWHNAFLSGVMIGLSCWLRSNAMLLPFFFALFAMFYWPRGKHLNLAASVLVGFLLTVAPLTIRNYLVFDAFVPISSGGGHNFIAGLADFDTVGREGLPHGPLDVDALRYEADLYGRPDYEGNIYAPDGIQRERDRFRRGINVVLTDPAWYGGIVLKRAATYFFRFERVPVIAQERDERDTTPNSLYYLNRPLKFIQRLFITAVLTPLFLAGAGILLWKRRYRTLVLIMVVPIYYLTVQSLIHTEYRYVLPSAHFQLILASVSLSAILEYFKTAFRKLFF